MKRESQSKNKMIYIVMSMIFIVTIIVFGTIGIMNYLEYKRLHGLNDHIIYQRQIMEKDDGWYYLLERGRTGIKADDYKYFYSFNGCNLKYETLDYSYALVTDIKTGEILQIIPKTPPTLSAYRRSKDGKEEKPISDEIVTINKFLERKQFHEQLTLEDLSEMKFENIDPNDIITLWNQFDDSKYLHQKDFGPYPNMAACNYLKNDSSNNYFQVGVIMGFGFIREVRMDYINENGEYLTDRIETQVASDEEKQLYQNIQSMEQTIIEKQSFAIEDSYPDLKANSFYTPLFDLLNQYEAKK